MTRRGKAKTVGVPPGLFHCQVALGIQWFRLLVFLTRKLLDFENAVLDFLEGLQDGANGHQDQEHTQKMTLRRGDVQGREGPRQHEGQDELAFSSNAAQFTQGHLRRSSVSSCSSSSSLSEWDKHSFSTGSPSEAGAGRRASDSAEYLAGGSQGEVFVQGQHAVKLVKCKTWEDREASLFEFQCLVEGAQRTQCILPAYDIHMSPDSAALRMELCEGSALDYLERIAASVSLQERELLGLVFLRDVATALCTLHELGVVHGDIKPENVLMSSFPHRSKETLSPACFEAASFKLSDFGSAFSVASVGDLEDKRGTLEYMAPEMRALDDKSGDSGVCLPGPHCDMWSLGVSFWALISGDILSETGRPDKGCRLWRRVRPETRTIVTELTRQTAHQRISAKDLLRHPALHLHPYLRQGSFR